MESYLVVFKAGYEVEAQSKEEAVEKAKEELAKELLEEGAKRFLVDVDEEPYIER